ncbi:MAG: RNA polymerase sigma factor [Chloroflexi bacterium]|nr:RNA polymerase sigma factor [Chloroflexota bacterium]
MTEREDDTDLVRRMSAGDEDALRSLYAAYGQRMYAYALRLTGDPAAAEDAVQDSLVAAWEGASRFRRQSRVIAWLLGIVHHKALNSMRGRQPLPFEEESLDPPTQGPQVEEQAVLSEQRRMLREGLAQLSWEHRTVLELVFYQRLSLSEAAEICGCPVGTIKSRLSYAKNCLRNILRLDGLDVEDIA